MKKLFSFLMVLALVFSMNVSAFAAETDGSITITNATIGQTYDLYKFFDATYAVDSNNNVITGADGKAVVSYTIDSNNPFYAVMFGADGTVDNEFFTLEKSTGVVTKKGSANDADIIDYLDGIADDAAPYKSIQAATDEVKFEDIETGYYLVDRGSTSTVTITSNMPDVEIIDKNQRPGTGFDKTIWDDEAGEGVKVSTSSIGDMVEWNISFTATNYDGEDIVKYYVIRDVKSSSLWVEFDEIYVSINTVDEEGHPSVLTLDNGYYHCVNPDVASDEWKYLGNWTSGDPSDADWYLIHYGLDEFEIVIPWLDDCTFVGTPTSYDLQFDLDEDDKNNILSEPKYDANVNVVVNYYASVGPDAPDGRINNSATLDWVTPEGTFGPDDPKETETKVYNLGITKAANDGTATKPATRLAGAIFELYSDEACTQPVYVIPTNNEGVYILDDADTIISGENRTTSREKYEGYWKDYIGDDESNMRNDMETPESGQLVVLGLKAGTYYLKETKAPEGYNMLTKPEAVTVGSGDNTGIYDNGYVKLDGSAVRYSVYTKTIENNQGVELPSTGGMGTMMLISVGTLVALAFTVLLITHKKMSIYND